MEAHEAIAERCRQDLLLRNPVFERFFCAEASRLAAASWEMARRFAAGGRLLAFGRGAAATDAQHVAVEFIHPIIVGKQALPAIDLGTDFAKRIRVLVQPNDMVMGFTFGPNGVDEVAEALCNARNAGALTFALAGGAADYAFERPEADPFICQEVFEVLYHVLWETVHVYLEHREQGHEVGASAFLYPFLGKQEQNTGNVMAEVQHSMVQKAGELNLIRSLTAECESGAIAAAAKAIAERLKRGGKIITFGNGGSATDANDFAADCADPPQGMEPIPAISLAAEPANLTAIANDIGVDAVFARQLIAHGNADDVAVGFSTSGGSANILAAMAEARNRGMHTVAILGYDGGHIVKEGLADHAIVARSDYIPRIQEAQASIYHVLLRRLGELAECTR